MAIKSGFFNAMKIGEVYDREYDAREMSQLFDGLILDGVFQSIGNGLVVKALAALTITVSTGKAWFNQTYTSVDAPEPIAMPAAHTILNRIDTVVIEVNTSPSVRANSIKVITGNAATTPSRPSLVRSEYVNQYPLAYVYRKAESTTVTQGDITNAVGTSACPFVIGVVKTMNVDALVAQWLAQWNAIKMEEQNEMDEWKDTSQAAFDVWFGTMQDVVPEADLTIITAQLAQHQLDIELLQSTYESIIQHNKNAVTSAQGATLVYTQIDEPMGNIPDGTIWIRG